MSTIKIFQANAYDPVSCGVESYYNIKGDNGYALCKLCVADRGIYYYRARSHILTNRENDSTLSSWDGFISMEDLCDLFEVLDKVGLASFEGGKRLKIRQQGKKVSIEESPVEEP